MFESFIGKTSPKVKNVIEREASKSLLLPSEIPTRSISMKSTAKNPGMAIISLRLPFRAHWNTEKSKGWSCRKKA